MTPQEIKSNLAHFYGSETFYKHPFGLVYTEGVQFIAKECKAYWLIDLVASYLPQFVGKEDFIVYEMKVENESAFVSIYDGNNNVLATQDISFTTFPLSEIEIWAEWNGAFYTAMLPTER